MSRRNLTFVCQNCGAASARWQGKCEGCGEWNSMVEEGDGTGGPGWTVPAEFNVRRHVKGVLSMARSAHPDSAGSQFFICLGDAPHLDGQYSAFGRVTAGMDVVEQIAAVECDAHGRPVGRLPEMRIVTA